MTNRSSEQFSSKKKILIVDDSEMNRSLLSDILSDKFDIMEAENGLQASALLQNHEQEISLMLLDIVMPEMDGFELLTLMNKKGWIKSIPVIMISAETVPTYIERAYDLGVLEYINRPFDERTVRHRVSSSIMLTTRQKELSLMVTEQMLEKEKNNRLMIEILSTLVEFRNGESGLHILHVQTITEMLLNALLHKTNHYSISEEDKRLICNAAALHDIGKIAIPSKILNKPGPLTKEEFAIMKTHSAEGARILQGIGHRTNEPLIRYSYQICRWHHERYDGKGYPDGLVGEEIPIAAQVVSIADVYDALTSKRVYKAAYSHQQAMQMILNGECGIFNPLLLDCLNDIEEQLEKEMYIVSPTYNSEKEILQTINQVTMSNEMSAEMTVSTRTLRLLEREKTKYQFVADMSQEIVFEYTLEPEMITLSSWGSDFLHLPETIINPRESTFGNQIFARYDFGHLLNRLQQTTPEHPIVKEKYLLKIGENKRWCRVICRSIWSDDTLSYEGAIGKIVDVHDTTEIIRQLEEIAVQDSLTGLYNHHGARYRISMQLTQPQHPSRILLLLNLDNFKSINNTCGHRFGDELLLHITDVIRENTTSEDVAARIGGDEFMILTERQDDVQEQVGRLFRRLSARYQDLPISVSIGVAFAEDADGSYENLFQMADTAMYAVKYSGKNGYRFYRDMIGFPCPQCDSNPDCPIKQIQYGCPKKKHNS